MGFWLTQLTKDKPNYAQGPKQEIVDHLSDLLWQNQVTLKLSTERLERMLQGVDRLAAGAASSQTLANSLDQCLTSFKAQGLKVFKPANDIRGDRIEPDPILDSLKLCTYKAYANSQFNPVRWQDLVSDTMCLRDEYWVSFDEDIWSEALAEFYEFTLLQQAATYSEATQLISSGVLGDQFFISVNQEETSTGTLTGHAIYAVTVESGGSKVAPKVIDNENVTDQKKIAAKFQSRKIDVYKRAASVALANKKLTSDERMAKLTAGTHARLHHLTLNAS